MPSLALDHLLTLSHLSNLIICERGIIISVFQKQTMRQIGECMIFVRDQYLWKGREWSQTGQRGKLNDNINPIVSFPNHHWDLEQDLLVTVSHVGLQWLDIYAHISPEMGFPGNPGKGMTLVDENLCSWAGSCLLTMPLTSVLGRKYFFDGEFGCFILCLPLICPRT